MTFAVLLSGAWPVAHRTSQTQEDEIAVADNPIVDRLTSSRKSSPLAVAAEFGLGIVVPRNVENRLIEGVCNELEIVDR